MMGVCWRNGDMFPLSSGEQAQGGMTKEWNDVLFFAARSRPTEQTQRASTREPMTTDGPFTKVRRSQAQAPHCARGWGQSHATCFPAEGTRRQSGCALLVGNPLAASLSTTPMCLTIATAPMSCRLPSAVCRRPSSVVAGFWIVVKKNFLTGLRGSTWESTSRVSQSARSNPRPKAGWLCLPNWTLDVLGRDVVHLVGGTQSSGRHGHAERGSAPEPCAACVCRTCRAYLRLDCIAWMGRVE